MSALRWCLLLETTLLAVTELYNHDAVDKLLQADGKRFGNSEYEDLV